MKYSLILPFLYFCSAELLILGDDNFQRKTLIGKHIPTKNWIVSFCKDECDRKLVE